MGDYNPLIISFQGQAGLKNPMQGDLKPLNYFSLYFTQEMVQKICDETKRYAHEFIH